MKTIVDGQRDCPLKSFKQNLLKVSDKKPE